MKTSKWNLATLPCPLCPALALCCPAPKRSEPKPCPALALKPQNGILQPCPTLCALPLHPACALPALHPALPLALALALALCCPAPKRSEPKICPALPSPFFSKSCKNVILRFSGLENLKMEFLQPCPALPLHPACALPALHPGLGPAPAPKRSERPPPSPFFQKVAKT